MKNFILHTYSFVLLLLMLSSSGCQKSEVDTSDMSGALSQTHSCSLSISVAPMVNDEVATKSITAGVSTEVKNLWIIQFDNSGEKVVGTPRYISESDIVNDAIEEIELVATEGDQLIIYIANSFNPDLNITTGTTLDQIKEYSLGQYYALDGDDNEYMIMSGYEEKKIEGNPTLNCSLKFNMAKVKYTINNTASDLTINSVQICNVPTCVRYFMDYEQSTPFPAVRDHTDLDAITVEAGSSQTGITDEIYMPANLQGSCEYSNELEENKPIYATDNSTYILVSAETNEGQSLEYRFYLGANLIDDYNILANYYYNYIINISEIGSVDSDARITLIDETKIDYTTQKPANCYIIDPSNSNEVSIYIPVVERINDFWGDNGYENNTEKTIKTGDEWSAEFIFYDNDLTIGDGGITLEAMADAPSGRPSLCVNVPANYGTEGNFTVMVKKGDNKLWSWHFWVTKYNPYDSPERVDDYHFNVTDGEVHRYSGGVWESGGAYDGKYIMDRPLGSILSGGSLDYHLSYQYGRKDPIAYVLTDKITCDQGYASGTVSVDVTGTTIAMSIDNPTTAYTSTSAYTAWLSRGNNYTDKHDTVWGDPNYMAATSYNETEGKSIFDPSPLGWKVAGMFTWDCFTSIFPTSDDITSFFTFDKDEKNIDYYTTNFYSTSMTKSSITCRYWMSSPLSVDNYVDTENITNYAGAFGFSLTTSAIDNKSLKSYGCAVICVQE